MSYSIMDAKIRIRSIKFTFDEMTCEAKAPRKKDFCLLDDPDLFDRNTLLALKKRIQQAIDKSESSEPHEDSCMCSKCWKPNR